MATEGRAQRMDKDCPHALQLLLCGQLRAVSLPFPPPFVALRDAGSDVPSHSLGSCIRCDLCTPTNKDTEVKKHRNLHYQTWTLRRVHVTCTAMMQGSVSPSAFCFQLKCRRIETREPHRNNVTLCVQVWVLRQGCVPTVTVISCI